MNRNKVISSAIIVILVIVMIVGNRFFFGVKKDINVFTAFFAVPGVELSKDNDIRNIIADKTGTMVLETWLHGQSAQDAVAMYIASG